MTRKFIIRTAEGKPDSLKDDVTIALTLTPKRSCTIPPSPVALACMKFSSNSEENREFGWNRELSFAPYETISRDTKTKCVLVDSGRSPNVPAGQIYYLSSNDGTPQWRGMGTHTGDPDSSIAQSWDGVWKCISLVKWITCGNNSAYRPVATWPPDLFPIGASPDLVLQAYVVDKADCDGTILLGSDCTRPLFMEPLSCDELPESSSWWLTEGHDGVIRFKKVQC